MHAVEHIVAGFWVCDDCEVKPRVKNGLLASLSYVQLLSINVTYNLTARIYKL